MSNTKVDPLYTIFEQHLFNFQDPNADRKTFIDEIVKDYLTQMRKMGLSIPNEWETQILEELSFQVNTMLVKKIYGCMTINEFITQKEQATGAKSLTDQRRRARKRYLELTSGTEALANQTVRKRIA